MFIKYHTSILEREINELNEKVIYWVSHKYIREGNKKLNKEVVYWISHKYIREGNKLTKRGSRLLNITQV